MFCPSFHMSAPLEYKGTLEIVAGSIDGFQLVQGMN